MKNMIPKMKNTLDKINSRLDTAEEEIWELADIAIETIQNEVEKKRVKKIEQCFNKLWEISNMKSESQK